MVVPPGVQTSDRSCAGCFLESRSNLPAPCNTRHSSGVQKKYYYLSYTASQMFCEPTGASLHNWRTCFSTGALQTTLVEGRYAPLTEGILKYIHTCICFAGHTVQFKNFHNLPVMMVSELCFYFCGLNFGSQPYHKEKSRLSWVISVYYL